MCMLTLRSLKLRWQGRPLASLHTSRREVNIPDCVSIASKGSNVLYHFHRDDYQPRTFVMSSSVSQRFTLIPRYLMNVTNSYMVSRSLSQSSSCRLPPQAVLPILKSSLWIIRNQWQQHSCGHHAIRTSTSQYPTLEIARTTASIRRRIVHHSSASCAGRSTQTVSIVERTSIDTSSEVRAFRIRRGWRRTSGVTVEVRDILSDEVKTVVDSERLAWVRRRNHTA